MGQKPRRRRDGEPAGDNPPPPADGEQLANGYDKDAAKESVAFISEQRQIIADASMKIAAEMKSIEKRGGNRQAIQFAMRMMKQDATKTRAELEAMDEVREWLIAPMLKAAADAAGSSEG